MHNWITLLIHLYATITFIQFQQDPLSLVELLKGTQVAIQTITYDLPVISNQVEEVVVDYSLYYLIPVWNTFCEFIGTTSIIINVTSTSTTSTTSTTLLTTLSTPFIQVYGPMNRIFSMNGGCGGLVTKFNWNLILLVLLVITIFTWFKNNCLMVSITGLFKNFIAIKIQIIKFKSAGIVNKYNSIITMMDIFITNVVELLFIILENEPLMAVEVTTISEEMLISSAFNVFGDLDINLLFNPTGLSPIYITSDYYQSHSDSYNNEFSFAPITTDDEEEQKIVFKYLVNQLNTTSTTSTTSTTTTPSTTLYESLAEITETVTPTFDFLAEKVKKELVVESIFALTFEAATTTTLVNLFTTTTTAATVEIITIEDSISSVVESVTEVLIKEFEEVKKDLIELVEVELVNQVVVQTKFFPNFATIVATIHATKHIQATPKSATFNSTIRSLEGELFDECLEKEIYAIEQEVDNEEDFTFDLNTQSQSESQLDDDFIISFSNKCAIFEHEENDKEVYFFNSKSQPQLDDEFLSSLFSKFTISDQAISSLPSSSSSSEFF